MSSRYKTPRARGAAGTPAPDPRAVTDPVAAGLRELAAFAARGGEGTPAAGLAALLAEAAGNADTGSVCRLATEAAADPQQAAAVMGVLAFALADTARQAAIAKARWTLRRR